MFGTDTMEHDRAYRGKGARLYFFDARAFFDPLDPRSCDLKPESAVGLYHFRRWPGDDFEFPVQLIRYHRVITNGREQPECVT